TCFFFNDTAPTEIYTLSLHDALPIYSRFPSSPQMVALMGAYQDQLKDLGLEGLGIRPLPNPLKKLNGDYAGSESCQNCHEESYRVWKKSPHSHAFATLKTAVP